MPQVDQPMYHRAPPSRWGFFVRLDSVKLFLIQAHSRTFADSQMLAFSFRALRGCFWAGKRHLKAFGGLEKHSKRCPG